MNFFEMSLDKHGSRNRLPDSSSPKKNNHWHLLLNVVYTLRGQFSLK